MDIVLATPILLFTSLVCQTLARASSRVWHARLAVHVVKSMAVVHELIDFLTEVESVITQIRDGEYGISVDNALLNAEWLLRDILVIEDLLPQEDGEALTAAITTVVVDLQVIASVVLCMQLTCMLG